MTGIVRSAVRFGLVTLAVGGVVVVGTAMIAGPQRTHQAVHQVQVGLLETFDIDTEDPRVLRSQLRELEEQYPQRIGELRGDLAELRGQIAQLVREEAVSRRVVELSRADLEGLTPLVQGLDGAVLTGNRVVSTLRYEGRLMTREQALARVDRIRQTQEAYSGRAADAAHDMVYLRQQEERMEELLVQLETEHTRFQAQLWQLERQVDAIARNERLIEMLDERQAALDHYSDFEIKSLDAMTSRLGEVRSRQEAELEFLAAGQSSTDYEGLARLQLQEEDFGQDVPLELQLGTPLESTTFAVDPR